MPLADLLEFERDAFARGEVVVGLDEVGRGALAGPLVVGAVLLRASRPVPEGLDDSKRLTAKRREALVPQLREWADATALGEASALEIDTWGLRFALALAANRAVAALALVPTFALEDGNFHLLDAPNGVPLSIDPPPDLPFAGLAHATIVKGDQRSATIAAASVLAKVYRDNLMVRLSEAHPMYGWSGNKGYGADEHLAALRAYGPCDEHRRSWNLPVASDFCAG